MLLFNFRVKGQCISSSLPVNLFSKFTQKFRCEAGRATHDTLFFESSIDAAGSTDKAAYFFRACFVSIWDYSHRRMAQVSVKEMRLPCHVDAAWQEGESLVLVRGNQLWLWGQQVAGPLRISQLLHLSDTGITICPSDKHDDDFPWRGPQWKVDQYIVLPRILRERHEYYYEDGECDKRSVMPDDDCVRLDSAFKKGKKLYLISHNSYVTVDESNTESRVGRISDWRGIFQPILAAVHSFSNQILFFKHKWYYSYGKRKTWGPLPSSRWDPVFMYDVDAASTKNGMFYFFRGCYCKTYRYNGQETPGYILLGDIGLPCNLDAAWSDNNVIFLVKYDQIWTWGENVTGPFHFSSRIKLHSWTICSKRKVEWRQQSLEQGEPETGWMSAFSKPKCFQRVDAALKLSFMLVIYQGSTYTMLFRRSVVTQDTIKSIDPKLPDNLDAAVYLHSQDTAQFYKGGMCYKYVNDTKVEEPVALDPRLKDMSIDAVTTFPNETIIYFSGCRYIYLEGGKLVNKSLADEQIPCNVDAVWEDDYGRSLKILKDYGVWTWTMAGHLTGPVPFSSLYTLTTTQECPSETLHNSKTTCMFVEAALTRGTSTFLIANNTVYEYEKSGKMLEFVSFSDVFSDLPFTEPTAALYDEMSENYVFFKDTGIYFLHNNSLTGSMNMTHPPLPFPPDAASILHGEIIVFSGCWYVFFKLKSQETMVRKDLRDDGLPCDVDAAWIDQWSQTLTILKGDQIWHWGSQISGPANIATLLDMSSLTVCPGAGAEAEAEANADAK